MSLLSSFVVFFPVLIHVTGESIHQESIEDILFITSNVIRRESLRNHHRHTQILLYYQTSKRRFSKDNNIGNEILSNDYQGA